MGTDNKVDKKKKQSSFIPITDFQWFNKFYFYYYFISHTFLSLTLFFIIIVSNNILYLSIIIVIMLIMYMLNNLFLECPLTILEEKYNKKTINLFFISKFWNYISCNKKCKYRFESNVKAFEFGIIIILSKIIIISISRYMNIQ